MKKNRLLVRNGQILLGGRFTQADILCENGRIHDIGEFIEASGADELDASGCRIIPGIIDAHTHGAVHVDVNAAGVEGLRKLAAFYASQGVTAFHASVLTDTPEVTEQCLKDIQTVMKDRGTGAQLLGAHLEGPFLSAEFKGAMPEHLLRKGDPDLLRGWMDRYPDVIRYITVSPEVPGVTDMIRELKDDAVFAIGHSGADYATAMAALDAGARCATHTFNAMRPFHHHEPGIIGAVLESGCWCEAICDGRHLAPSTVRMLLKCKGMDRVMAITDSLMAAGLPDGRYKLGVNDVTVINGDARLTDRDVRAGSTLTAVQGLRNVMRFTGRPLEQAARLFSENPAIALRLYDWKGALTIGRDADMVLLTKDEEVRATVVGGQTVYSI